MANERELPIVLKARDEASKAIKSTDDSIAKLSASGKKAESEFSKFTKTLLTLGAAFATLKRIASSIPEVLAAQESAVSAIGGTLEYFAKQSGYIPDFIKNIAAVMKEGDLAAQIMRTTDAIAALRKEVERTGRESNVLSELEYELRVLKTMEGLSSRGMSIAISRRVAAERVGKFDPGNKFGSIAGAAAGGFGEADILGVLGLGDTPEVRKRVQQTVEAIRSEVANQGRIQKLANEFASIYNLSDADANKLAKEFVDSYTAAFKEEMDRKSVVVSESFKRGFDLAAKDIADQFEDLTKIGEQFANDLFDVLNTNFFRAAKQEFRSFGDFAKSILEGILNSILAILSRLAASQLLNLGSSLFGGLTQTPRIPIAGSGAGGNTLPFPVPGYLSEGGSSSSGSSTTIQIHIHATDADSFSQMVARNPSAITNALVSGISRNGQLRQSVLGALAP